MISLSAEYALRAAVCLAAAERATLTNHDIAVAACIPPGYLAKVLHVLVRGGIVTSQRGLKGGFVLARPPSDITCLDIVHVADGIQHVGRCPLGVKCQGAALCALHRRLDQVISSAEGMLADSTLADILTGIA